MPLQMSDPKAKAQYSALGNIRVNVYRYETETYTPSEAATSHKQSHKPKPVPQKDLKAPRPKFSRRRYTNLQLA